MARKSTLEYFNTRLRHFSITSRRLTLLAKPPYLDGQA